MANKRSMAKWQYFDTVTGAQAKNQYIWIGNQHKEVYYDGLGKHGLWPTIH